MSLLQQDSRSLDDAARGEELTKGSTHVLWASVVATVVVTIAIAVYVLAGEKPPAVVGDVEQVWAHPIHTESSGFDASGAVVPKETYDQVLVFAQVKLHNQSDKPLFLHQIMTNAKLDDGIHSSYAAIPADYERVFVAYPAVKSLRAAGLSSNTTIAAGQTQEGMFVSAFKMTKEQWDARKDLNFSFVFQYQPTLVLTPHTAITEQ
jgi:hypothetical protein